MFHHITKENISKEAENYTILKNSFEDFLNSLIKQGYIFKNITEINLSNNKNNVCITFDDGFADTYTIAYPILKQLSIPFCVFITTNYIGMDNYLTKEMLIKLSNDPLCTIGAHSISHKVFRKMETTELEKEISECKVNLEKIINKNIDLFAYPYGSIYAVSSKAINIVKKAGYKYAYSTIKANLNHYALRGKYFIPRINICEKNYKRMVKL